MRDEWLSEAEQNGAKGEKINKSVIAEVRILSCRVRGCDFLG
jgi:hypothetical protein